VLVGSDITQLESNETFTLTLSNAVNAIIGTATATGTILNDDAGGFASTPWSCVLDQTTGLMWEVKTTGVIGGLHNADYTYSWFNNTGTNDGGDPGLVSGGTCQDGAGGTNCDTEKFTLAVNGVGLCGYTDWRLPYKEDLRSIVDYSVGAPGLAIDTGYFPNATTTKYWSASPYAVQTTFAWLVDFNLSSASASNKAGLFSARLVRGGL